MRLESTDDLLSLYSEALETAQMGVWRWDIKNNALAFDAGLLSLYELTDCAKMHTIEDWASFLAKDQQQAAIQNVKLAVSSDFVVDHQFEIHLQSGHIKYIRTKAKKIRNEKNEIVQLLGVNWDVTAEVVRQHEKQDLVKKINSMQSLLMQQSKLAVLGEVTAGIAHEVNNPLSIIVGKLNMIEQNLISDRPDQKKMHLDLVSIQKNADRITKIIRSLNSFSRNSIHDPFEPVSLLKIVDDAFEIMKEKFKADFVDFAIIIDENMNYENKIDVRESEILQVLINLLSNSYDAVQKLTQKWVKLTISETRNSYEISIIDSGYGVDPEIVPRMMEPFYTTKNSGVGVGLGLSLSSQIIKSHGGSLEYQAAASNTEFVVSLKKCVSI